MTDEFYKEVFNNYAGLDTFIIAPILLQPKSRRLTLKSSNPSDLPVVDINYYDHVDDKNMIEYGRRYKNVPFPGCKHIVFKNDAYWTCIARHVSGTQGHYVGTCKMDTRRRNSSVVDHRLQVYGISVDNLRVVDNSVMPTIIADHTNALANMIAEKASDMIKEN